MTANQNLIISDLSSAIYWASNLMWKEDKMPLESQLEDVKRTRQCIEDALKELEDYEKVLMNK